MAWRWNCLKGMKRGGWRWPRRAYEYISRAHVQGLYERFDGKCIFTDGDVLSRVLYSVQSTDGTIIARSAGSVAFLLTRES